MGEFGEMVKTIYTLYMYMHYNIYIYIYINVIGRLFHCRSGDSQHPLLTS